MACKVGPTEDSSFSFSKTIQQGVICKFPAAPSYRRGQWSNGRIPLPATLIPAAANREADCTVVVVAVEVAAVVVQAAEPGIGPGRDGGGPPITAAGQVAEISVVVPTAARQGSEARRIRRSRIR